CWRIGHLVGPDQRRLCEVTGRYADGDATRDELLAAQEEANDPDWAAALAFEEAASLEDMTSAAAYAADNAAHAAADHAADYPTDPEADQAWAAAHEAECAAQAALLRELFGNPFCPRTVDSTVLTCNEGVVLKLAQAIYEERAFDRMPILA